MVLEKLFDGVADRDTTFQLINRYSPTMAQYNGPDIANPHHGDLTRGQWFELKYDEYMYFMEVLPPLAMTSSGFAMSEYCIGNLTSGFFELQGRWFCMTLFIAEGEGEDDQEHNAIDALRTAAPLLAEAIR